MFCLQSHYRKSLVFSYENLDNATTSYRKLVARIVAIMKEEQGTINAESFDALKARFTAALDNDLNTSLAVTALYDVLKAKTTAATKLALIADFDRVLDIGLIAAAKRELDAANKEEDDGMDHNDPFVKEIEEMIRQRAEAKKAKDYAKADEIRKTLSERGVTLIDTPQGTKFKIEG